MGINRLVTGGNGFVGKNISFAYKLTRSECDLLDFHKTVNRFRFLEPKHVIHTAGRIGGLYGNMSAKADYYLENILINTHVLHAAYEAKAEKVLSLLSTCIFPDDPTLMPYKEKNLHLGEPHESNFAYSYAKRMLDIQSRAYKEQYGVNFITITPVNIYGPGDHFGKPGSHVVPELIYRLIKAKEEKIDFVIKGSGKALREFMYIDDLTEVIDQCLDFYDDPETLIVSPGIETSIETLVNTLVEITDFKGKVVYDTTYSDGQLRKPSDISKFRKFFPHFLFTPLKAGLTKTIDWVYNNYDEIYSNHNN